MAKFILNEMYVFNHRLGWLAPFTKSLTVVRCPVYSGEKRSQVSGQQITRLKKRSQVSGQQVTRLKQENQSQAFGLDLRLETC